jgi:7-carboxy-7-deazaguanine synthase (Cx14CxxC type)
MSFAVKEIFYTLQGEGANVGRAAVFCRFAGCNLWTGREEDRADAICDFCDTDFVGTDGEGGGRFPSANSLADAIDGIWPAQGGALDIPPLADQPSPRSHAPAWEREVPTRQRGSASKKFVVCTGGEPLLQMTDQFVRALHARGFEVAIETNGTKLPPPGIDWICVSPKASVELVLRYGNELKLIYPQAGAEPQQYEHLDFAHFFLQPMDGPQCERNTQMAVRYCLEHPRWRLSLQTQKVLGIK